MLRLAGLGLPPFSFPPGGPGRHRRPGSVRGLPVRRALAGRRPQLDKVEGPLEPSIAHFEGTHHARSSIEIQFFQEHPLRRERRELRLVGNRRHRIRRQRWNQVLGQPHRGLTFAIGNPDVETQSVGLRAGGEPNRPDPGSTPQAAQGGGRVPENPDRGRTISQGRRSRVRVDLLRVVQVDAVHLPVGQRTDGVVAEARGVGRAAQSEGVAKPRGHH